MECSSGLVTEEDGVGRDLVLPKTGPEMPGAGPGQQEVGLAWEGIHGLHTPLRMPLLPCIPPPPAWCGWGACFVIVIVNPLSSREVLFSPHFIEEDTEAQSRPVEPHSLQHFSDSAGPGRRLLVPDPHQGWVTQRPLPSQLVADDPGRVSERVEGHGDGVQREGGGLTDRPTAPGSTAYPPPHPANAFSLPPAPALPPLALALTGGASGRQARCVS